MNKGIFKYIVPLVIGMIVITYDGIQMFTDSQGSSQIYKSLLNFVFK